MVFALAAVVLAHAHVVTMNPAQPEATTLAVVDGKIEYVGDDLAAARKAAGPKADLIDAGGRTVMPGFDDAHVHFGLSLTLGSTHGVDLPESSKRAWVAAVKKASAAQPGGWLFVKTRTLPEGIARASDLEFVDRPLFVVTSRGGLLNARGLQLGKFTDEEAPHGFVRGRELAAALDRLVKAQPLGVLEQGARKFLAELARLGITSVQLIDELPELFESLRVHGQLTARVRMVPLGYRLETRLYEPTWNAVAPDWVRVDGIKYFHDDGARITRFELQEIFDRAVAAKRQVLVHVLSSHALETLLSALESMAKAAHRPEATHLFRIEHADEVTAEQARRLARLGIVVCSNPSMLPEWHSPGSFPMRTLTDAGVRTCIGTDWVGEHVPVRPLEPMLTLGLAVTHGGFGDRERISVREAIEAYTVGSAAAEGKSGVKGSLEPGKLADLIVLSDDPLKLPPEKLPAIEVLLTMVGGRIVHRVGDFAQPPVSRPPPPTIGPEPPKRPPTIAPGRAVPPQ
jgi:predicted amidohydrolase YtcJ